MDRAGETGQTLFLAAAGRKMSQPAQIQFATSAPCKLTAISAPLRDLPQLTRADTPSVAVGVKRLYTRVKL